jgi:hypothetical protein
MMKRLVMLCVLLVGVTSLLGCGVTQDSSAFKQTTGLSLALKEQ